jgi:hypothetical protein
MRDLSELSIVSRRVSGSDAVLRQPFLTATHLCTTCSICRMLSVAGMYTNNVPIVGRQRWSELGSRRMPWVR